MKISDEDLLEWRKMQLSPLYWVHKMYGLEPMKDNFTRGKNISLQQAKILAHVGQAIKGKGKRRITIRSGHGIGKTTTVSWVLLWFLMCYKDCQIACTAPTVSQMHDVLWKEAKKWIDKMPEGWGDKFERTKTHIRVNENPEVWFARAKTARKEDSEALAGVHGEHVMIIADEASGIDDEIFSTMEGALTEENYILILISNPTRLEGYFYDSHQSEKWDRLHFNSEESPLVTLDYVRGWEEKYSIDSDEYRIRVLGEFPRENVMDDRGYVRLIHKDKINFTINGELGAGRRILGIDPAGTGRDTTRWIVRDSGKAQIVAEEKISNAKGIAQKTATLMLDLSITDVVYDNFGVGANVGVELAFVGIRALGLNVGDKSLDSKRFVNKRSELFWKAREWLFSGGELVNKSKWEDLGWIKYKRDLSGRIKIQPKIEIKKDHGGISPDVADAFMMTFALDTEKNFVNKKEKKRRSVRDPLTGELKKTGVLPKRRQ